MSIVCRSWVGLYVGEPPARAACECAGAVRGESSFGVDAWMRANSAALSMAGRCGWGSAGGVRSSVAKFNAAEPIQLSRSAPAWHRRAAGQ